MAAGWFRAWRVRAMLRRVYLRRQQATATAKDRDAGLAGTRDDHARANPPLASGLASGKPLSHKLLPLPGTRSRHPASTVAPHGSRLATHELLAQWAVEEVLLSSDLLDAILYHLDDIEDGAQASVCSQWAEAWKTLRRKLPLRVRAQRQRRAQQSLAVADPHRYRPLALLAGQYQGNFPVTLKFRSLFYDCGGEEEVSIRLASQHAFDRWTCKGAERLLADDRGKATLWVKREADLNSFIPVSQLHVMELHTLAEAVQAQDEATATGTYLFMEHPTDLTRQLSDGTRCHWTEGNSLESLEHLIGWNCGDYEEDDAKPMPPGPSYQQMQVALWINSLWVCAEVRQLRASRYAEERAIQGAKLRARVRVRAASPAATAGRAAANRAAR